MFSGLAEYELGRLARMAVERRIKSGKYVFWEGDAPDWFYVVADGRIRVVKHSPSGKDFIIAFFGPGEMFGEVAVFQDRPYPASAQAAIDTTVIGIRKTDFLDFLKKNPSTAISIINVLGARLREAQARMKDLAAERAEQRLARVILMLYNKLGDCLPFTRQEIASMAGTTIETAIRVLSRLKGSGIIKSSRGRMTVAQPEKLRLLAEGPPEIASLRSQ
ncbi:MAG: Crp/Fnr family transcriptional regulator [Chloroflexota bacterium]